MICIDDFKYILMKIPNKKNQLLMSDIFERIGPPIVRWPLNFDEIGNYKTYDFHKWSEFDETKNYFYIKYGSSMLFAFRSFEEYIFCKMIYDWPDFDCRE